MDDTSLSDFAEAGSTDGDGAASSTDADAVEETADERLDAETADPEAGGGSPVDPATVEPAAPTATWRPAGDPCAACGEPTGWRWPETGRSVCADCVDWDRV